MDTTAVGELFKAVWNAFPDDLPARERIYEVLDREANWSRRDDPR